MTLHPLAPRMRQEVAPAGQTANTLRRVVTEVRKVLAQLDKKLVVASDSVVDPYVFEHVLRDTKGNRVGIAQFISKYHLFKRKPKTTVIYSHGSHGTQAWTRDADGKLLSVTRESPPRQQPMCRWSVSLSDVCGAVATVLMVALLGVSIATVGFWWTVWGIFAITVILGLFKTYND